MDKNSYIIGVAGGSGSGKTSFVNRIKELFDTNQLCILSLDNYYLPREEQHTDANGIKNFDLPQSIKSEDLARDITLLMSGKSIKKMEYVFNNEKATSREITILPAPIIIVEGLFIYHYENIRSLLDLKLYVHAKDSLKLIRRIKRDKTERNYPLEDVIYRFENHVLPSYEQYIGQYKEDIDLVINNNNNFNKGLEVVTGFIRNRLNQHSKQL